MKSLLIGALLAAAATTHSLACGAGGSPDPTLTIKAQISYIDNRLNGMAAPAGLDATTLARIRELRRESADLFASAIGQRSRSSERSSLAARQLASAREKAAEALIALGVDPASVKGPIFRCGISHPRVAQG